jgi:hypothetical protein
MKFDTTGSVSLFDHKMTMLTNWANMLEVLIQKRATILGFTVGRYPPVHHRWKDTEFVCSYYKKLRTYINGQCDRTYT